MSEEARSTPFLPAVRTELAKLHPDDHRVILHRGWVEAMLVDLEPAPPEHSGEKGRTCPTCGESGPDTITQDFDSGMREADCGDPFHDPAPSHSGEKGRVDQADLDQIASDPAFGHVRDDELHPDTLAAARRIAGEPPSHPEDDLAAIEATQREADENFAVLEQIMALLVAHGLDARSPTEGAE